MKSPSKHNESIPTLTCEGVDINTDAGKAELLNKQFSDNFNHSHPPLLSSDFSCLPTDPSSCPDYLLCTEEQVFNLIAALHCSKVTGTNTISARMLKGTLSSVLPSLTNLFNLSIRTGMFPQSWKCARVVPIPKKDLSILADY